MRQNQVLPPPLRASAIRLHFCDVGPAIPVLQPSEITALHSDAFESRVDVANETNWRSLLAQHSLGWVTARVGDLLLGFVNVIWDGQTHAWIQDVMVNPVSRNLGIGSQLVATAAEFSREAGCEWLHVDFEERLGGFYFDACGFTPTTAGLIRLQ